MASKPGSEAAHDEKLAELAGPAASFIATGPRKYPKLAAEPLETMTADGFVCRRKYAKVSAASAADLIAQLPELPKLAIEP